MSKPILRIVHSNCTHRIAVKIELKLFCGKAVKLFWIGVSCILSPEFKKLRSIVSRRGGFIQFGQHVKGP